MYEGEGRDIFIMLRNQGKNFTLLISPDRSLPRLHLVTRKTAATAALHPFNQYLKSRIAGSRLASIALLNGDRVVEILFSRQEAEYRLIVEMTGSASNLVVTDPAGTILAVYHPVPPSETNTRPLISVVRYELPAKRTVPEADGIKTDPEKNALPPVDATTVDHENRAAEIGYDRFLEQRRFASVRSGLVAGIKKLYAKASRRYDAISADQDAAAAVDDYKRAGELILAHLNDLRTGMKQAELAGYDGKMVVISLEPEKSPKQNAEQYFRKYRKAKAGRVIIAERLQETREELTLLEELQSALEKARDEAMLLSVRAKLPEKARVRTDAKKRKAASSEPSSYRRISCQGWEILIGKSAAGNDYITMKIAGDHDLWLHAEGLPGSHVVIRNPEKRDVPPEVLRKAAELAAFYSKGRGQGKVSVAYTFARYVRKPRGAKPGLVTLSERKTVMAVPRER